MSRLWRAFLRDARRLVRSSDVLTVIWLSLAAAWSYAMVVVERLPNVLKLAVVSLFWLLVAVSFAILVGPQWTNYNDYREPPYFQTFEPYIYPPPPGATPTPPPYRKD